MLLASAALPTTWNPSDKNSLITLSGGNLVAARSTLTGDVYASVRGTRSRSTGKRYFEVTVNTSAAGANSMGIGIATASFALTNLVGFHAESIGALSSGATPGIYFGGAVATAFGDYTAGDVICVAVDLDAELIWFRKNGGAWSGTSGNPATGVGGTSFASLTPPYFPAFTGRNATATQVTANFGATAFAQSVPSGFGAWNG